MELENYNDAIEKARGVYQVAPAIGKQALVDALNRRGSYYIQKGLHKHAYADFREAENILNEYSEQNNNEALKDFFTDIESLDNEESVVEKQKTKEITPEEPINKKWEEPKPEEDESEQKKKPKKWPVVFIVIAILSVIGNLILGLELNDTYKAYRSYRSDYYQVRNERDDLETLQSLLFTFMDSLPTAYGPVGGILIHNASDEQVANYSSDIQTRDAIVSTTFINPYDHYDHDWDYGFFMRRGSNGQYRLIINSDKTIYVSYWNGSSERVATGRANQLNTKANEENEILVFIQDSNCIIVVNGEIALTTDKLEFTESGWIQLGSGFFSGDEITGEVTGFTDFKIWSLD